MTGFLSHMTRILKIHNIIEKKQVKINVKHYLNLQLSLILQGWNSFYSSALILKPYIWLVPEKHGP